LEEDSLESLAREDLLRAEVLLGEIEELIKKLDSLRKA